MIMSNDYCLKDMESSFWKVWLGSKVLRFYYVVRKEKYSFGRFLFSF